MEKLTPKDKLELFYFIYAEWGVVALPGLYNVIVDVVENGGEFPSLVYEEKGQKGL